MAKIIMALVLSCLPFGCTATPNRVSLPPDVTVSVDLNGGMETSDFGKLAPEDLPSLAKEVGDRPVHVVPNSNGIPFQKIVEARNALRAAGVKQVVIGQVAVK